MSPASRVSGAVAAAVLALLPFASCGDDSRPSQAEANAAFAGTEVAYIQRGPSADDAPLTVLFLHGASANTELWVTTGILAAVADAGYHAVAIDLPGYGRTPRTKETEVDFLAEAVVEFGGTVPEVVIVSPSMSGIYSLGLLASGRTDGIAGVVPVAPVGVSDFVAGGPVDVPALIVWGTDDHTIPIEQADTLATALPDSRIERFEGLGHGVQRLDPKGFTAVLLAFLAELSSD